LRCGQVAVENNLARVPTRKIIDVDMDAFYASVKSGYRTRASTRP
jgi:hypothetical protein